MKKHIAIFAFLLSCCQYSQAMQIQKSPVDSLHKVLESISPKDSARLCVIRKLALLEQSTNKGKELAKQLYTEADKFKNNYYKCYALYYSSIYYFNQNNKDSLIYIVDKVEPIAEKEKLWLVYFDALKLKINMYSIHQNYELAIDEAQKMHIKAKEVNSAEGLISADVCMAVAYLATDRTVEGVKVLEEAYKLIPQTGNQLVAVNVLSMLLSTCHINNDYTNFWKYKKSLEDALARHIAKNTFSESYYTMYMYAEIQTALYYLSNSQPKAALPHLEKAQEYRPYNTYPMYEVVLHDAYATYYNDMGQYEKALAEIDSTLFVKGFYQKDYYRQLVRKADLLVKLKRGEEAMPLYQEALLGKDSLSQALSNQQMEQIQEIYNVNKLIYESQQIKNKRQFILLSVILVILILLTAFIVRILFVRHKLKESEHEMRDAMRGAQEANEIKNRFLTNMSYNIRTPLNGVVGFSQLLAVDPNMDEELRKEYSTIIKQNSDELMKLVNNVLDLSRLESGMMKFSLMDYDLNTLCNEAMYTVRSKGDPIKVDLRLSDTELLINTDIARFNQSLVSILTYPVLCEDELQITLTVSMDVASQHAVISIVGSPLATPSFNTQEVIVRNEINRLFMAHFGGSYTVAPHSPAGPEIVITYPLTVSE